MKFLGTTIPAFFVVMAIVMAAGCGTITEVIEVPVTTTTVNQTHETDHTSDEMNPEVTAETETPALVETVNIQVNVGRKMAGVVVGAQDSASFTPQVGSIKGTERPVKVEVGLQNNRDFGGVVVGLPKSGIEVSEDLVQKVEKSFYDKAEITIVRRNKRAGVQIGIKKPQISIDPQ